MEREGNLKEIDSKKKKKKKKRSGDREAFGHFLLNLLVPLKPASVQSCIYHFTLDNGVLQNSQLYSLVADKTQFMIGSLGNMVNLRPIKHLVLLRPSSRPKN